MRDQFFKQGSVLRLCMRKDDVAQPVAVKVVHVLSGTQSTIHTHRSSITIRTRASGSLSQPVAFVMRLTSQQQEKNMRHVREM